MMAWTPEHRLRYAQAIEYVVRNNAITHLATTIDMIDPPAWTGRPRLWSTLMMVQALWWLCRAGSARKLLPGLYPPRQTIGSRLERWRRLEVLERALAVPGGCLRLAHGRKRRRCRPRNRSYRDEVHEVALTTIRTHYAAEV